MTYACLTLVIAKSLCIICEQLTMGYNKCKYSNENDFIYSENQYTIYTTVFVFEKKLFLIK